MKRIVGKMVDILVALKEDILRSFNIYPKYHPYRDEPNRISKEDEMAVKPNKLRRMWRSVMDYILPNEENTDVKQPTRPLDVSRDGPPPLTRSQRDKSVFGRILLTVAVVMGVVAMAILAASLIPLGGNSQNNGTEALATETTLLSPSATSDDGTTWKMTKGNYAHNRWFGDGIKEIRQAKTKRQAEEAAAVWLDKVKRDPVLLAATAKYFFKNKNITKASLVDKNGWATDKAVQLVANLQMAIAQSKISPNLAPPNGTNSGVANGRVVGAATAGINGNRKAILIIFPNGKKIWVMARCGNPVVIGSPPVPPGPTDNRLQPKNWRLDPYAQGNAPQGGGPNKDKGPGQYVKPGNMTKPPNTPYTPPPTPKPTTPPGGSTPDPVTPPPAEPDAPTPDNPAGGEVTPPGM